MHQYLKAIGFGNFSAKKELKEILGQVEKNLHTRQSYHIINPLIFVNSEKISARESGLLCMEKWMKMKILMQTIILPIFKAAESPHTLR